MSNMVSIFFNDDRRIFYSQVYRLDQACNFIEKETLAQAFFCEFCDISKNTFSYRTPLVAVFDSILKCNCFSTYQFPVFKP